MYATIIRRLLAVAISVVMMLGLAVSTSAHEHREIGEYEFSVGFRNEPAYLNQPNGIHLSVTRIGEDTEEPAEGEEGEADDHGGAGVEGLHETLQAEITIAGETKTVELEPVFGESGVYTAPIVPTMEGAYTFRFFGTIEGMEVNESFTGGPDTFSEVESIGTIAFPATAAEVEDGENSAVSEAQDSADSARTLAIIGIIAGVLGLAVGAAGAMMAMNARSARTTTGAVTREAGD